MSIPGAEERQRELHEIDRQYPHMYWIISGILIATFLAGLGTVLFVDLEGYKTNLFIEVLSIVVTILVLDRLNAIRADKQLKAQLIREIGSGDNSFALRAITELKARMWLFDGSLREISLWEGNLKEARLACADLYRVILVKTNLEGADLSRANLQEAQVINSNLQGAKMWGTNLQGAALFGTNLKEAMLVEANLKGADLSGADLHGAKLFNVNYDENTKLPDGTAWFPGANIQDHLTQPEYR